MVDAEVMRALGPDGVLINVGRGTVVDERALVAALQKKEILTAGLDVFEDEPRVPKELIAMDHIVLLPHVGSASVHTRNAMGQLVVDNLKYWFAGKWPLTPVAETPRDERVAHSALRGRARGGPPLPRGGPARLPTTRPTASGGWDLSREGLAPQVPPHLRGRAGRDRAGAALPGWLPSGAAGARRRRRRAGSGTRRSAPDRKRQGLGDARVPLRKRRRARRQDVAAGESYRLERDAEAQLVRLPLPPPPIDVLQATLIDPAKAPPPGSLPGTYAVDRYTEREVLAASGSPRACRTRTAATRRASSRAAATPACAASIRRPGATTAAASP